MIEVKNLVKKYGNHVAVDDLSFSLELGKIYGFLGPNGAGKSTTMNIMTGYLGATSGDVIINGHNILEEPIEAKKCIGYLPEIPPLYMDMTVNEYLDFAAKIKGIDKAERKSQIEEAKKLTRIVDVENRLIKNLSKGYRQRVGLANAILGFPDIIILDEPTVGLDPKQIIEIREMITELAKNHTIIFSSHILSEVSAICDYVLIISHGKLVASDDIENLYKLGQNVSTLEIKVKGEKEDIEKTLKAIDSVKITEMRANNYLKEIKLEYDGEDATIEKIFYGLADKKLPIYEMSRMTKSLEELFLELTDTEDSKESKEKDEKEEDK